MFDDLNVDCFDRDDASFHRLIKEFEEGILKVERYEAFLSLYDASYTQDSLQLLKERIEAKINRDEGHHGLFLLKLIPSLLYFGREDVVKNIIQYLENHEKEIASKLLQLSENADKLLQLDFWSDFERALLEAVLIREKSVPVNAQYITKVISNFLFQKEINLYMGKLLKKLKISEFCRIFRANHMRLSKGNQDELYLDFQLLLKS